MGRLRISAGGTEITSETIRNKGRKSFWKIKKIGENREKYHTAIFYQCNYSYLSNKNIEKTRKEEIEGKPSKTQTKSTSIHVITSNRIQIISFYSQDYLLGKYLHSPMKNN